MVVLADNDILLKLGACRLLDDFPSLLGATLTEVYVLPTARFKIRGSKKELEEEYTPEGIERALDFIDAASELSGADPDGEQAVLTDVEGIDAGEAVLFTETKRFDDFRLVTGDKKSLRALAEAPGLEATKTRLAGRVFCFEQLMRLFIDALGFEVVCRRVVPVRSCDGVLRIAFSDGAETTRKKAVYDLQMRTPQLTVTSEPLLAEL